MKTIRNNWKVALIVAVGIVAVILLCVFGVQSSQNRAFALEEQVYTADSDIKVQEKRRVDLVYNLADCVKQYDKHEAETLTAIVEGRGSTDDIENVTTAITAVSEDSNKPTLFWTFRFQRRRTEYSHLSFFQRLLSGNHII